LLYAQSFNILFAMSEAENLLETKHALLKQRWNPREVRPLTTDERASFVIVALYLVTFCISTFVFGCALELMIIGITAAVAGVFLFVAAFFNTEAPEKSASVHPLRSYLVSFFWVLLTLFLLRLVGGLIKGFVLSVTVTYVGLIVALIVFRKAMIQVISSMLVLTFLFVTFHNLPDVLAKRMSFTDTVRQCGLAIFQIGPIQDVANVLLSGSYVSYLKHIDYRADQIRIMAAQKVAGANDDELLKTKALLNYVSNDIHYLSDPDDGLEYVNEPQITILAEAGDCEDQAVLLCSLLEAVGVKTYMAFTDQHVFVLVRFSKLYPELSVAPYVYIDDRPCYALDPADPRAVIGWSSALPIAITRVFDVRDRSMTRFTRP
jgi:hypothetical protein